MSPELGGPRDWDKELANIDKLIAATPAAKASPAGGAPPPPAARSGGGGSSSLPVAG
ncbi:MAG: hypothetical protein FJZ00_14380, partial [Candidatus Sericytochromatia bacterium]|nr:hypothetical protein [Candidatus Tanganyikabacteria bacterium]